MLNNHQSDQGLNFLNGFRNPEPTLQPVFRNTDRVHQRNSSLQTNISLSSNLVSFCVAQNSGAVLEGEDDAEVPTLKWCAYCKAETKTEFLHVNNRKTFWSSVGIFMSGGVLGCFLLPYMTNHCKGKQLVCHKCKKSVG